jgi:hypothetical protein
LPQIVEPKLLRTQEDVTAQMGAFRRALTLELVGGTALEVKLQGTKLVGLADKLETVVARLMEGLTGPEQGVLNARQFIMLRKKEAVATLDQALSRRINQIGSQSGGLSPERILTRLAQSYEIQRQASLHRKGADDGTTPTLKPDQQATLAALRREISNDPAVVDELDALFTGLKGAQQQLDAMQERSSSVQTNYVGFFETPESILVVGRPKDPLYGENPARKFAVAGLLLSILLGVAMALIAELFAERLTLQSHFAQVSGLPVVARIPVTRRW